ncbi:MAG: glycosyltransferase family 2 protein [Bacteroidota bacterium]|nr:glycosyltransferase family 2 protein [Bacteroidota bacterium]
MDISVVVPLLNEEESLPELVDWIKKVMIKHQFSFEIILVDDGSKDNSWHVIHELSEIHPEVKGIKFRKNYGKSAALHTGFGQAKGDVVISMDADLQDNPDEIPELFRMIKEEDYDLVSGWKKKRYDPITKTIPSKFYNRTARTLTGIKLHDFNCGLKAYKNEVVKNIEVYGEMHRYIPVIAKKAGFSNIGEKIVQHQARKYGVTKFGLDRFIKGYLDLLSITFISKFSQRPMHLFGTLGTLMFLAGFLAAAWLGGQKLYFLWNNIKAPLVADSPIFYIALTSMIMGTQLFLAGFLGELISRSSSDRNNYQIEQKINL